MDFSLVFWPKWVKFVDPFQRLITVRREDPPFLAGPERMGKTFSRELFYLLRLARAGAPAYFSSQAKNQLR